MQQSEVYLVTLDLSGTNGMNPQICKRHNTYNNLFCQYILDFQGKVGVDGKELLPSATPKVNGFGFVATPSPAPGEGFYMQSQSKLTFI